MSISQHIGTTELSDDLIGGPVIISPVYVAAGTYTRGTAITNATLDAVATEARAAIITKTTTLASAGYVDAIVHGVVQKAGIANYSSAVGGVLFLFGIFVK